MSDSQSSELTQHAFLVVWGEFGQRTGLIPKIEALKLHQKRYHHSPQGKIKEFLVATLAGLEYLKDISRSAQPLDQDRSVAQAWGETAWADASGVSRTLQSLTQAEAEQTVQALNDFSQVFIDGEVNRALWLDGELRYYGDLTGLAVSKSSRTYPQVAYGHMDDRIRLGYQAAVVSMDSPSYDRLWLSGHHHPGNWVSAQCAEEMILGAEACTQVRPWRRTELLEQRLQKVVASGLSLEQRLEERTAKVCQAAQALEQVQQQLKDQQQQVDRLTILYQEQQRPQRPTSQLAAARKKLSSLQARQPRREKALAKARQMLARNQEWLDQHRVAQSALEKRLEGFRQDNRTNPHPVRAIFCLDAGFGTYQNLALAIEMGYEVYTKLNNWKVQNSLIQQVSAETTWTPVGSEAAMVCWPQHQLEGFSYPLDVALERFTDGDRVKHCLMIHFGATAVSQDLPAWFNFYAHRQTIEAGIKESKQVFYLNRIKVRSLPAIYLQERFVLFAANYIRWADDWLAQEASAKAFRLEGLGMKELVQVAANTSAEVIRNSESKLLRFSKQSVYAGKELKLPVIAFQLPLPLGKSYDFSRV